MANKQPSAAAQAPNAGETPADPQLELLRSISESLAGITDELASTKDTVTGLGSTMAGLADRVSSIEKGGRDDFMKGAREEDVAAAAENRKGIDPKIVSIVDETLGTDFGIELAPLGDDRLGYLFTLAVPERMNDAPVEKRPVKDPVTGEPVKDAQGNVRTEDYRRPDLRSRIIASADGYGAVREHCEKVRAYITASYASSRKPMPALKVR